VFGKGFNRMYRLLLAAHRRAVRNAEGQAAASAAVVGA
jgi:hypothetical protein